MTKGRQALKRNIQNLSKETKLCNDMPNRTSRHTVNVSACVCAHFIDIACSTNTIAVLFTFFDITLCYMNAVLVIHIFIETFFVQKQKIGRFFCSKTFSIYTQPN